MTATSATPEKRTLADEAYTELKSRIMRSALVPGAKLSIDGLAKQLAFSQTPIREALARLESEGLLARRPLSGYTVQPLLSAAEFEVADRVQNRLPHEMRPADLYSATICATAVSSPHGGSISGTVTADLIIVLSTSVSTR